jgi:hypothetical protein
MVHGGPCAGVGACGHYMFVYLVTRALPPLLTHCPCARSIRFSLLPEAEQAAAWPATAGPFRPVTCVQVGGRALRQSCLCLTLLSKT